MASHRRIAGGWALAGLAAGLLILVSAAAAAQGSGIAVGTAADPAIARYVDRWTAHIKEASARFGIPTDWIRRVMRAESGGRATISDQPITSRAGAMGLMQLMPGTWVEMRDLHGLGSDPHDPRDNILAGTAYLRAMYDRFGYPGLFAAYNAGPARYTRHLATGRRLPAETVIYVAAVGAPGRTAAFRKEPPSGTIFALVNSRSGSAESARTPAALNSLFVPLNTVSVASE